MSKKNSVLLLVMVLLFSCSKKNNSFKKCNEWEQILKAVKEKQIDYLLNISSDTLKCLECDNGKSLVTKEVFFKRYFEQMKLGGDLEYSFFIEDLSDFDSVFTKRIRISYKKEYKKNKYDIIYTLLKGEDSIKFIGVFSIP